MKHTPQEFVGNCRSKRGKYPPIAGALSAIVTRYPISARTSADCMPAIPPPTTRTSRSCLSFMEFSSCVYVRFKPRINGSGLTRCFFHHVF